MIRFLSICFALLISNAVYGTTAKSPVILLSVDGFSFSYLEKYQPKNLLAFAKSGVNTRLLPVYPSKTFPNHLSIITGTYPVNHGIIHNRFYHPELAQQYSLGAGKKNKTWLTSAPLWSVAEDNGIKSAIYFWPESETIGHTPPSYNIPYNKSTSNRTRIDQLITWLKLPRNQRPNFIASYFSTIDSAGHHNGFDTPALITAINEFDTLFGYFIERINREISQSVNIILVSDHGMVPIAKEAQISTDLVLNNIKKKFKNIKIIYNDTQLFIYFDKHKVSNKIRKIRKIRKNIENILQLNKLMNKKSYNIYTKGSYPLHWHLNSDIGIVPDIIIEAEAPAIFTWKKVLTEFDGATHGFDPKTDPRLQGIFMASGPNITQGRELEPFKNIHVFPLLNALLGLNENSDIDGQLSVLKSIIK